MKTILLSFDLEEFDMPLEYGKTIDFDEQIRISYEGTKIILDFLLENKIPATFFSTVVFARHAIDLIQRIRTEGHELASHGYFHSSFENDHLRASRCELEKISGSSVRGFRMARMMKVDNDEVRKAAYLYNSSLNPIYLPGRYNNFFRPRKCFSEKEVLQIPASTTPIIRIPLFWLSFHNFPLWFYQLACRRTINHDQYLHLYFHPWEFMDISNSKFGLPSYVTRNSGAQMNMRFRRLIEWMKNERYHFQTLYKFYEHHSLKHPDRPYNSGSIV